VADYGRVVAVNAHTIGDQLVGAHGAGVVSLQLDDASDFDADGGIAMSPAGLLTYDSVDHDTDTMSLVTPLPTALADETRIDLWDPERADVVTEVIASIALEGTEDEGDPFEATVPHGLRAYLPDGIRTSAGEVVEIDVEAEEVIDIPGRTPQIDGRAVWNPHSRRTFNGQTLSNATWEKLLGWSDLETDGITFTNGTWTVVSGGWYAIDSSATWTSNATGRRRLRLMLNGVVGDGMGMPADPDSDTQGALSPQLRLIEGDQIELWAFQSSGAGLQVKAGAFSISRLSI